jgi:hypothetical protein
LVKEIILYINGLCHSRPCTVGPCFILLYFTFSSSVSIWVVTCFTPAKLSVLHSLCWVFPCAKMQTFSFSWFCTTCTCCLHNFMIKSHTYWILTAICKSREQCAPWKVSSHVVNDVLKALHFQNMGIYCQFPADWHVIIILMSVLWRINTITTL